MSHKLLYDDIKAEYKFHSLINATVSHELRNPLNSMICQLQYMNHNLGQFDLIRRQLEKEEHCSPQNHKLQEMRQAFNESF